MAAPATVPFRLLKRSLIDTRGAIRPSIRSLTTVSHSTNADAIPEPLLRSRAHPIPERDLPTTPKPITRRRKPIPYNRQRSKDTEEFINLNPTGEPREAPRKPKAIYQDATLDPSIRQMLPLLKSQPPHYMQIQIHEKPYLVTQGDIVRLPFHMPGVQSGDILRINRATLLGSRDYTLKPGLPRDGAKRGWLDENLYVCRARVLNVELEPMRFMEKTKRRQRHVKTVKSKHAFTVLRIMEITVNDPETVEKLAQETASKGHR